MITGIAERLETGAPLDEADARAILDTSDLIAVGSLADDVRRRMHGTETTFQRVFEIHMDAIPSALPSELVAGEIRIIGSPSTADAAVAAVTSAAAIAGTIPVSGFALADLLALANGDLARLEAICADLRKAGLQLVAETALDTLEAPEAAIAAARRAGLFVSTLMIHDMPAERRVELLVLARQLQDALGGFRAFAPLPRGTSAAEPTTGYDDVKLVALARMLVTNIPSIQVDWQLYGPKLAQFALTVGADDVDRVAAIDVNTLGRRRTALEEIRGNIKAAGLEPRERNARWEAMAS